MRTFRTTTKLLALGLVAALATLFAATLPATAAKKQAEPVTLRLGYFPNVTHASAIVGVESGIFKKKLGSNVTLDLHTFNSGTEALQAFQAEALDASYIGPSPTISVWTQVEQGREDRVGLGVRRRLLRREQVDQQRGRPQGQGRGVAAARQHAGRRAAHVAEVQGSQHRHHRRRRRADPPAGQRHHLERRSRRVSSVGAWVPEPWATRLVTEGGGKILVDEADLWPQGRYVTTQLIVTTSFLKDHPDVVQKLVDGQVAANDYIKTNPFDAQTDVSNNIARITGKPIPGDLVIASFKNIQFTDDPIASSLVKNNKDAAAIEGLTSADSLKGIYDLSFLNTALKADKEPTVPTPKL